MTLFWDTTSGAVERYRLALGTDVNHVESSSAAGRAIQEDPRLAVVVLGPAVDFEHGCDLAEWLRIDRPEIGVIMIRQRLDVTVLSQALRSGIRDVVAADDLTALSEAVVRSRDLSARMNSHSDTPAAANGKVVTIFSAKGGVGKTTLATNVGAELAHNGVQDPPDRPRPVVRRRRHQPPAAAAAFHQRRGRDGGSPGRARADLCHDVARFGA